MLLLSQKRQRQSGSIRAEKLPVFGRLRLGLYRGPVMGHGIFQQATGVGELTALMSPLRQIAQGTGEVMTVVRIGRFCGDQRSKVANSFAIRGFGVLRAVHRSQDRTEAKVGTSQAETAERPI